MTPETLPPSDEEAIRRVRSGDPEQFEVLMRRYNQRLYRAVRSVFPGDPDETEDVVQDAWVRAYAHLDQFEGKASFSTWVVRIGLHEAWARARRGRRLSPIGDDGGEEGTSMGEDSEGDPERKAAAGEMRSLLEDAVEALPESYRTVFVLRSIEELSTAETAQCLDLTQDVVKTRLHRARALLKRELLARAGASEAALYPFAGARCDRIVAAVLDRIKRAEPSVPALPH